MALNLAAQAIRIEAPIPGQRAVGIEVPNVKAADVRLYGHLAIAASGTSLLARWALQLARTLPGSR